MQESGILQRLQVWSTFEMNIEGVLACEYENIVDKFGTWSFCVICALLNFG
jgi:hypothetical protein